MGGGGGRGVVIFVVVVVVVVGVGWQQEWRFAKAGRRAAPLVASGERMTAIMVVVARCRW